MLYASQQKVPQAHPGANSMLEKTISEKIKIRIHQLLDDMGEANPRERVFMAQAVKELYLSLNLEGSSSSVDWMAQLLEETQEPGPKAIEND